MEPEALLQRVRKLRAVAEGTTNRHEAENALLLAQRLLVEHDLAETDAASATDGAIEARDVEQTGRPVAWRVELAGAVAPNFRCLHYLRRTRDAGQLQTTTIRFVGRQADVALAAEVYRQAGESACRLAAAHVAERRRVLPCRLSPGQVRTLGTSFLLGFASGLARRFAEQRARHQEWALVLARAPEVDAAMAELLGPNAGTWRARGGPREGRAWGAGFSAGREHDPQPPRRALPDPARTWTDRG